MSKKCPACKTELPEPLPERCPVCNLDGLNQIFLTREDYEYWKENVLAKHIKKMRTYKVSVGHDGVLVLLRDGKLFGFGNNTQGQYCPNHIGEKIIVPQEIAEDVISASAGYNYSLYLDAHGKVHFLGNSGIPFKERFEQGDLVFEEVFARNDVDIFGARTNDGKFYVWGDNSNNLIENLKESSQCDWSVVEVKCGVEVIVYADYGTSWQSYDRDVTLSKSLHEIETEIKYECSKNFGLYEGNLNVKFTFIDKCKFKAWHRTEDYPPLSGYDNPYEWFISDKYEWDETYKPQVYYVNRYIFQPLLSVWARDSLFEKNPSNEEKFTTVSKDFEFLGETIHTQKIVDGLIREDLNALKDELQAGMKEISDFDVQKKVAIERLHCALEKHDPILFDEMIVGGAFARLFDRELFLIFEKAITRIYPAKVNSWLKEIDSKAEEIKSREHDLTTLRNFIQCDIFKL